MPNPDPKLSELMKKLQEENAQREQKIVLDLKVRHAEDIRMLRDANVDSEKRLITELTNKCAQNTEQQARIRSLVVALLKTKSERDKILLATSWMAIGALVIVAVDGLVYEVFSGIFMFVALAGFIAVVLFTGHNLKINSKQLIDAMTGTMPADLVLEKDDGRPIRSLLFGLFSAILLVLTLYINYQEKIAFAPLKAIAVDKAPVIVKIDAVPTPQASPEVKKTTGNGGNFAGGFSH